ncbi:RidA family protein [Comamonas antarctica]|uniref:RidA family protein n=1 Tax=Comamonas antarctica TaxID=2743470 RepID=A0A6N1X6U1_9BURK|nr:RidA family protein [Comamonas antarctica]QKV55159.1 RidA family protein [Comamonas antarctica]
MTAVTHYPASGPFPFSSAVRANGWVLLSGQIPFNAEGKPHAGDIGAQTQAVMDSVCRTLEQVGSSIHDVVKVNVWLSDLADFAAFNAVYAGYFDGGKYPVRSLVQAGLAFNVKVEVEVQALDRQQAGH